MLNLTRRTLLQTFNDFREEIGAALGQKLGIIVHHSETLVTGQIRWILQQKLPQLPRHTPNSNTVPAYGNWYYSEVSPGDRLSISNLLKRSRVIG